jgi:hypothetical protein
MNSTDRSLLTGAGFTANFGAPLARGVWEKVFRHRQLPEPVRALLRESFDFEGVYHEVLNGEYSDEDRAAIKEAVRVSVPGFRTLERSYP